MQIVAPGDIVATSRRNLRQVDRLDSVAVRLDWGMPARQERSRDLHMILPPHLVQERREGNLDLPAEVLPVLPSFAKLGGLRALPQRKVSVFGIPERRL